MSIPHPQWQFWWSILDSQIISYKNLLHIYKYIYIYIQIHLLIPGFILEPLPNGCWSSSMAWRWEELASQRPGKSTMGQGPKCLLPAHGKIGLKPKCLQCWGTCEGTGTCIAQLIWKLFSQRSLKFFIPWRKNKNGQNTNALQCWKLRFPIFIVTINLLISHAVALQWSVIVQVLENGNPAPSV